MNMKRTAIVIISLIIGVFIMQCLHNPSPVGRPTESENENEFATSGGQSKAGFSTRAGRDDLTADNFASTAWDFFFKANDRTPDSVLPMQPVDLSHFNRRQAGQLNATWLGHSSLMINIDSYKVLTDPVFEKRVSILGPTRFNGEVPVNAKQLPFIDVVIISHDHYDHLNKFSVKHLNEKTKQFVVPLGVGARMAKWGIPPSKITELDWWEAYPFDQNLTITATPAQHFSGRGLTDRNQTLWASWVIETSWHNLFFSGDSGYFDGFKQIGKKYGPFDMTFIECGAYNESWSQVHMFPEQTVQAHLDLGGNILHPIHWGTFNLALHPWYEPMQRVTAASKRANVELATPMVGGTTIYGETGSQDRWWNEAMPDQTVTTHLPMSSK
jgi:L-ascorbate metabolism protein UlaG (beta-lactamase superfamily)